jgi:hypothetical protein
LEIELESEGRGGGCNARPRPQMAPCKITGKRKNEAVAANAASGGRRID